ncbi:MAG: DUF1385 domain-containing protein, partial [Chloroflexota bacterium]
RGVSHIAVAVRRPRGDIAFRIEPVLFWSAGRLRRIPFLRGILILAETLVLGMKALQWSTNVALEQEDEEVSGRQIGLIVAVSLLVAGVIFFATPTLLAGATEGWLHPVLVHLVEGTIRIGLLLGYLWLIGRMADVRRLFAYHGAEHKTIHAYEAGVPLEVAEIQRFSPAHPRCGTSFLLTVMVVSLVVFALLGQPPVEWRLLSRIILLPFIAGVSYEILRFGAIHLGQGWVWLTVAPGLALQRLTTRQPDDDQVEVALASFNALRAAEGTAAGVTTMETAFEINA